MKKDKGCRKCCMKCQYFETCRCDILGKEEDQDILFYDCIFDDEGE